MQTWRGGGWRCAIHPAAQWRSAPDLDCLLSWIYLGHIDVFLFVRGVSLEFVAFVGFGCCFPSLPAELLILPLCLRLWCLWRFSLCTMEDLCCLLVSCSSGGREPLPVSIFLLESILLLSEVAGRKTFCKADWVKLTSLIIWNKIMKLFMLKITSDFWRGLLRKYLSWRLKWV